MSCYKKALQRLFSPEFAARPQKNPTLEPILKLLAALSLPHTPFPSIHIAGTNGKGSVALKMAAALEASGCRVGLYTSPHLTSFQERIAVNGKLIPEEIVGEVLEQLFEVEAHPTFFCLATALAFKYFRDEQIDVAVLEVGLGGAFDATNVVTPLVSVITSIGWDHMAMLGNSLEEIAAQKAGIIKPHVPVVVGPTARFESILGAAKRAKSRLIQVEPCGRFYDEENSAVAACALNELKSHFPVSSEDLALGLVKRPPCRFENVEGVIFDVAHNIDGFKRLFEAVSLHFPEKRPSAVIGLAQDKQLEDILALAAQCTSHLYLVQAVSPRAAPTALLAEILRKKGYKSSRFSEWRTIEAGVEEGRCEAELLVVCGSFLIMQAARQSFSRSQPPLERADRGPLDSDISHRSNR